jgi:RibD C-terminal domain
VVPEHRSDGNGPQHVRSGPSPWGENPWNGWWGNEPPFHQPVYVLTHHACDPVEMQGGTSFHFVIDGIESALGQAQEAADGKDVSLGGGANVAQQYLTAGLIDEMEISVVLLFSAEASACSTGSGTQCSCSNRFGRSRRCCTSSTASGERRLGAGRIAV